MSIMFQSSADVSPSVTPSGTPLSGTHAPKYGTVIPNRIFVGGIAANVSLNVNLGFIDCSVKELFSSLKSDLLSNYM